MRRKFNQLASCDLLIADVADLVLIPSFHMESTQEVTGASLVQKVLYKMESAPSLSSLTRL